MCSSDLRQVVQCGVERDDGAFKVVKMVVHAAGDDVSGSAMTLSFDGGRQICGLVNQFDSSGCQINATGQVDPLRYAVHVAGHSVVRRGCTADTEMIVNLVVQGAERGGQRISFDGDGAGASSNHAAWSAARCEVVNGFYRCVCACGGGHDERPLSRWRGLLV